MLVRNIARELLPYVVLIWATFALLGGALEPAEGFEAPNGGAVAETGLGLCVLGVAYLLKAAVRVRPLLRHVFSQAHAWASLVTVARPVAYFRPSPSPPSLELLQILRT
jgi:hypothetical protein